MAELPNDTRAERRLIGAVATDPGLLAAASLETVDFWDTENQTAWATLTGAIDAGRAVQPGDYYQYLDAEMLFLPENVAEDARRVRRAAYCRAAIESAGNIARAAYQGDAEHAAAIFTRASRQGLSLSPDNLAPARTIADDLWEEVAHPEAMAARFVPTGLPGWDSVLGRGLERGTLSVVMARPAMGKTALFVQIADYVSEHVGPVAVFSKEMTARQWLLRTACRRARVGVLALKQDRVSGEAQERVLAEIIALSRRDTLRIDDSGSQSTDDVLAACDRMSRGDGLALVIADHLRLFNDRGENENKRMGAISWAFKRLAKSLDIPVLVAAQLNRGVEGQSDKRPDLKDLRDSGEIEENADNVDALYRDGYYTGNALDKTAELIHRKGRDGERNARAQFVFLPEFMSFELLQGASR